MLVNKLKFVNDVSYREGCLDVFNSFKDFHKYEFDFLEIEVKKMVASISDLPDEEKNRYLGNGLFVSIEDYALHEALTILTDEYLSDIYKDSHELIKQFKESLADNDRFAYVCLDGMQSQYMSKYCFLGFQEALRMSKENYIKYFNNFKKYLNDLLPSYDPNKSEILSARKYKIFKMDNFKCQYCGRSPATSFNCELHVDHIIPRSKCGSNDFNNLITACNTCNLAKNCE